MTTALEAANALFKRDLATGYVVAAIHSYEDENGGLLYTKVRLENAAGEKIIRPLRPIGDGWKLGEPAGNGSGKPLYRLADLRNRTVGIVYVVEGEKAADALCQIGATATTSGGATSAASANWDCLRGRHVVIWADNDDAGRLYAREVAKRLRGVAARVELIDEVALSLPQGGDAVDWLELQCAPWADDLLELPLRVLDSAGLAPASAADDMLSPAIMMRADEVCAKAVAWLWQDWIAIGKFTLLAGAPGCGKTTLAVRFAKTVTRGDLWPDGTAAPQGHVLIWSSEDDVSDTLKPRLVAAGADCSRVSFITGARDRRTGVARAFDPATDLDALALAIEELGDVRLVVIDTIASVFPSGADSHQNAAARRALGPVRDLAERANVAILGIGHFSKNTGGRDPTERVNGSIAMTAQARAVLIAAKGEDGRRFLTRAKNNLGQDAGGWAYSIEAREHQIDGVAMIATTVEWGEAMKGTAREMLADAEASSTARHEAVEWLSNMLALGPMRHSEIRAEANAARIGWRTIERAKAELRVVSRRLPGQLTIWEWALPDQSNSANSANSVTAEVAAAVVVDQKDDSP